MSKIIKEQLPRKETSKDNSNSTTYFIESILSVIGNSSLRIGRKLRLLKYKWAKRGDS